MKICHIINHPNLNGGIFSVCEIINGLKKYNNIVTDLAIVNRTGTDQTTKKEILDYYKIQPIGFWTPEYFLNISKKYDIIVQHRLHGTKPFISNKTIVVNHTSQAPYELINFNKIKFFVSVSSYLEKITTYPHNRKTIIRNGIDPTTYNKQEKTTFTTGRCHRIQKCCLEKSLKMLNDIENHQHIVIGNHKKEINKRINYIGEIINVEDKMKIISNLDLFFYDVDYGEGTSMAVLEALSVGVPVITRNKGGTNEIVIDKLNGHYFSNYNEAKQFIIYYKNKSEELKKLSSQTKEYFEKKLHIKHTAKQYAELFEKLS